MDQVPLPVVALAMVTILVLFSFLQRKSSLPKSQSTRSRVHQRDNRVEVLILPEDASAAEVAEFERAIDKLGPKSIDFSVLPRSSRLKGAAGD